MTELRGVVLQSDDPLRIRQVGLVCKKLGSNGRNSDELGGINMKRLVIGTSGLLVIIYLNVLPPTSQRIPADGLQQSLAKAAPKTPDELLRQNKKVSDKLSVLLGQQNPPVTDLEAASKGFKSLYQLVITVHASHNLGIPFEQLKTAVQTSGSLSKTIHVLKPDADVKAAVREAVLQALEDLDKTPGVLLAENKKLSDKLSALLQQQNPPVTDLQAASQGFTDLAELFTAVHVSDNLGIPFEQLKTVVQTSGSLSKAIHRFKPEADVESGVREALLQALEDLDKTPGVLLAQNEKLSVKLSSLLRQQNPPVTDLQAASQGFTNLGELFAAVHVSDNLGIPFDQLKTQERTGGSLEKAIHVLKPNADAAAELWEAAMQAADDLEGSHWVIAPRSSTSI
jgi:hypothetical protein